MRNFLNVADAVVREREKRANAEYKELDEFSVAIKEIQNKFREADIPPYSYSWEDVGYLENRLVHYLEWDGKQIHYLSSCDEDSKYRKRPRGTALLGMTSKIRLLCLAEFESFLLADK